MLFASLNAYTMANGGLSYNLETLLVTIVINATTVLAAVNNLMTVLISGVRGQKSSG